MQVSDHPGPIALADPATYAEWRAEPGHCGGITDGPWRSGGNPQAVSQPRTCALPPLEIRQRSADHGVSARKEAPVSDAEPIRLRPRSVAGPTNPSMLAPAAFPTTTFFTRRELNDILNLYGRKVAAGEWRDYAIDFGRDKATFSIFRRSSEVPLYRIEKQPRLARKQGAFSVLTPTGLILKRGNELRRVLAVLDDSPRLAAI